MRLDKIFFIVMLIFPSIFLSAQTKEDLKKQRSQIEKDISYTTELLNKTQIDKNKSLNYLKVLERQIKNKEQLLITLKIETSLLNKQIRKTEFFIKETQHKIEKEEERLIKLKAEYAKMIYAAFKKKGSGSDIMFIVSASDFNQAYKRLLYLKQYSEFRKNQVEKINETQQELIKKKEQLAQQKDRLFEESATKTILAGTKKNELKSVNSIKHNKQELIQKLSKSENVFKNKIVEQQKKAKELDEKIRKIIKEEIEKAKAKSGAKNYRLTPEALAISSEFRNNQGKLPWPLEKGVIVGVYGKQTHPIFKGVETFNNGVDIATDKNALVRVVFDGVVSRIFFIKGEGKAVLINHGEYFSVYSGLKDVSVKVGEKLFSKEKIGVVITQEEENKTELHFEIWKGYEKQNPSSWLYNAY